MTYLLAFLFCGFVCAVSQYVLEKTKFTPGHMNTILVIVGCMLSGFGIYDKLLDIFKGGASIPIMNFGHLLVTGARQIGKTYLINEFGIKPIKANCIRIIFYSFFIKVSS